MTLLEAFQVFLDPSPIGGKDRETAAQQVQMELTHLAATQGWPRTQAEEAVQNLVFRLLRRGPQALASLVTESENKLRAYLLASLRNHYRDLVREGKRTAPLETAIEPTDRFGSGADHLDAKEVQAALRKAQALFRGHILPAATQGQGKEDFLRDLACLEKMAAGEIHREAWLERIMREEGLNPSDRTAKRRMANRYDQRFSRIRQRLRNEIQAARSRGEIADHLVPFLLAICGALRFRE